MMHLIDVDKASFTAVTFAEDFASSISDRILCN